MALKPQGNNIVGGTSLVIDRINSPGYVAGVSGWTINQDGSAEFNNVTIRGALVIGGTQLYYSGTPAANNLVASVSATAGTDPFGNDYLAGEATYHFTSVGPSGSRAVAVTDAGITWYSAASGTLGPWSAVNSITSFNVIPGLFVSAPVFEYTSSADGNVYQLGFLSVPTTATPAVPQTISSTAAAAIAASVPVAARAYRVRAEVQYAGAGAAGVPNFQIGLGSGAAATILWGNARFHDAVAGTSGYVARPTAWSPFAGPTLSVNNWMMTLEGYAVFTTGGAITLQAWTSVAADTYDIKNGFLDVIPA